MAQVVQAKCPHCKTPLRIPADWLHKPMRCKHCKKVFQAKSKAAATGITATPPVPQAAATGITATPPPAATSGDLFGFDDDQPIAPSSAASRRKKGGKGLLILAVLAVLGVAGLGTGAVVYLKMTHPKSPGEQVASDDAPVEGAGSDKTPKGTAPGKTKPGAKTAAQAKRPTGAPSGFPRRALLIGVNNYLMFNSLAYGLPYDAKAPGSSTGALRRRFIMTPPMNMSEEQVIELSDGPPKGAQPTQKAVIETTIKDFLEGCRAQDRIILLFAGHACEIEKDCFLIPIEGTKDDPATLIPLKWVYEQLAKCKARQKIFVIDAFRYAPARGFELPGAGEGERGEMGEVFDEALKNPPPGVQVWSACVKGQASIELDSGSAFLQAFYRAMQSRSIASGIGNENDPLPIDDLVAKTNVELAKLVKPEKQEQVSRLTGAAPPDGAPYDPAEPMPSLLAIKPPPAPPGGVASHTQVDKVLEEIKLLPPVRETRAGEANLLKAINLPPIPAKTLEEYKADGYKEIKDLREQFKKAPDKFAEQYPVRAAVFETIDALEESGKISMRESLDGTPGSPIDPKRKASFLKEQEKPAELIFELEKVLGQMKTVEEEREKEKSKRWQANFDYAMARLEARLVYLLEYNYLIAGIRADRLPDLEPGQTGWRVGTSKKIKINETKAKALVKDIDKRWKRIAEEYADTPWAVLAKRENLVAMGLEWRAKSD